MRLEAVVVLAGHHTSNSNDVNWPDVLIRFSIDASRMASPPE